MLLIFLFGAQAAAQEKSPAETVSSITHYKTAAPDNARYEIVQSEIAARWLFKLDRYTGQVYQLIQTPDGEVHWVEMFVWERPEVKKPLTARFQLFVSGFSAVYNILIDTAEGRTWIFQVREIKQKDTGESVDVTGWFPVTTPLPQQAATPARK